MVSKIALVRNVLAFGHYAINLHKSVSFLTIPVLLEKKIMITICYLKT